MTVKKRTIIVIILLLSSVVVFITGRIKEEPFEESVSKAEQLYSQGEYEKAIAVWKQLIKKNSENAQLYERIGRAFLKLANWNKAREYFEKASSMMPQSYGLDLELVQIYLLTGDLPSAEKLCFKLKSTIPDNLEFNTVYGDMMLLTGNFKTAEIHYMKAHISNPNSSRYALKVAICLVAQARYEDADSFFNLAQTLSDNSPKTFAQMAEYCILLKSFDRAENYLKQAIDLSPKDISFKVRLAQFYFLINKIENAKNLLTELVSSQQDNISFKKMLADVYISLNKLKEAESIIDEIKAVVGHNDPQYNLIRGKYWLVKGYPIYASTHLKTTVDSIPGFIFARYYLSVAYLAAGQKQLAENSLTKTLMYNPDHTDSQLLMADILYKKNKFDLSEEYINRVMAKETENYRVYMLKGLNALSLKLYDGALIHFLKAFKLDPQSVESLYYLGVSSEFAGRYEDAIAYYEQAILRQSGLIDLSYRYAMLLIKMGRADEAEKFADELLKKYSDRTNIYHVAAEVALKIGNQEIAMAYLEQAISKMACPAYFYIKLAHIYRHRGDTARSISIMEECIKRHPFNRESWITFAQLNLDLGDIQNAINLLEQAEKKLSSDPDILSNLAWLYLETDSNIDMALEYARGAYEKMPEKIAITDTLGWAYYKKGSFAQASWILKEAEGKEPNNGWILYHLAMSLYKEGKLPESLETFKKAALVSQQQGLPVSVLETVNQHVKKIENKDSSNDAPIEISEEHSMPIDDKSLLDFPDKSNKDEEDILEPQWQEKENLF